MKNRYEDCIQEIQKGNQQNTEHTEGPQKTGEQLLES